MANLSELVDALDRNVLCERLGITKAAISNVVTDGKFPPGWFQIIMARAHEKGLEVPHDLFKWRKPERAER